MELLLMQMVQTLLVLNFTNFTYSVQIPTLIKYAAIQRNTLEGLADHV
jgi:hypothetical protein